MKKFHSKEWSSDQGFHGRKGKHCKEGGGKEILMDENNPVKSKQLQVRRCSAYAIV